MSAANDTLTFVDLKAQYKTIASEVEAVFHEIASSASFILGPQLTAFEKEFAAYCDTTHSVGVASGLDALRLALLALGIGAGDEVIIPANTFIATALAASAVGAKPILVDCDPSTYQIDATKIEAALTPRTKAIIPVHLTGLPADMDPSLAIAAKHNRHGVEDAAQAHGALYKGRLCGSMGKIGCFSFFPGKNLGAYGDGGGVTTSDAEIAAHISRLRNYGQEVKYHHVELGLNTRLDTLQAAILSVKLKRLDAWNAARAKNAEAYRTRLKGVGDLRFQEVPGDRRHVYHLFIVETAKRDELQAFMNERGVQCLIHYPVPVHMQKAYDFLGHKEGDFPASEKLAKTMLSLPMYAELTEAQIDRVCDGIKAFFS